jgi:Domain of unknown function (DUF4365)
MLASTASLSLSPDGFATGRMVAAQVKSGPSFFENPSAAGWRFYPEDKHRNYWERFPLPVVLILHDPDSSKTYWTDARQAPRIPAGEKDRSIEIPRANLLEATSPVTLFENAGVLDRPFIPSIEEALIQLVTTVSSSGSFPLSYFDLFTHGLTSIYSHLTAFICICLHGLRALVESGLRRPA